MADHKNGKGFLISIGGNLAELVSVDESFNEVLVTWFTLDSDFAKNKVVALDVEYGATIKFDKDDTAHQALVDSRYSVAGRSQEIIITDPLHGATGSTITFDGTVASIGDTRQTDDVVELDVTIKIESGEPVIAAIV